MQSMDHHHHTNSHDFTPPPPPEIPSYMNQTKPESYQGPKKRVRPPQKKRNPLLLPLVIVSMLAVVLAALYTSTFIDRSSPETAFAEALEFCEIDESDLYISVEDDGASLIMSSEGTESWGAPIDEIACVLQMLDVPTSIINRIDTTRALDGTQTGTWDEYEATWNYHPNSGSNITITLVNN